MSPSPGVHASRHVIATVTVYRVFVANAVACVSVRTVFPTVQAFVTPGSGEIETDVDSETNTIVWWCPVCGENGYIRNWQGTLWDCATDSIPH